IARWKHFIFVSLPREVHAVDENAASRRIDADGPARKVRHFAAVIAALDAAAAIAERDGAVGIDRDRLLLAGGVGAMKCSDRPSRHGALARIGLQIRLRRRNVTVVVVLVLIGDDRTQYRET